MCHREGGRREEMEREMETWRQKEEGRRGRARERCILREVSTIGFRGSKL